MTYSIIFHVAFFLLGTIPFYAMFCIAFNFIFWFKCHSVFFHQPLDLFNSTFYFVLFLVRLYCSTICFFPITPFILCSILNPTNILLCRPTHLFYILFHILFQILLYIIFHIPSYMGYLDSISYSIVNHANGRPFRPGMSRDTWSTSEQVSMSGLYRLID